MACKAQGAKHQHTAGGPAQQAAAVLSEGYPSEGQQVSPRHSRRSGLAHRALARPRGAVEPHHLAWAHQALQQRKREKLSAGVATAGLRLAAAELPAYSTTGNSSSSTQQRGSRPSTNSRQQQQQHRHTTTPSLPPCTSPRSSSSWPRRSPGGGASAGKPWGVRDTERAGRHICAGGGCRRRQAAAAAPVPLMPGYQPVGAAHRRDS